jgi:hypothetical protein
MLHVFSCFYSPAQISCTLLNPDIGSYIHLQAIADSQMYLAEIAEMKNLKTQNSAELSSFLLWNFYDVAAT